MTEYICLNKQRRNNMTILFIAQLLITFILLFLIIALCMGFVSASFILYEGIADYVFAKFYAGYKFTFPWFYATMFLAVAFAIGVLLTALVWVAPFSVVVR